MAIKIKKINFWWCEKGLLIYIVLFIVVAAVVDVIKNFLKKHLIEFTNLIKNKRIFFKSKQEKKLSDKVART